MSSGHDHHDGHSAEPKTVSFRTPMILALVTVLIIVLAVNACDKKSHCCEGATCEMKAGGHAKHEGHDQAAAHEEHMEKHDEAMPEATPVSADSLAAPAEAPAVEAHH